MTTSRYRCCVAVCLLVSGFALSRPVDAGYTQFSNRAAFETAAASGGTTLTTETFNSFTQDTPFKKASPPVVAGPLTISEYGPNTTHDNVNSIDVSPFEFSGIFATDTTPYALVGVSADDGLGVDFAVQILFNSPVSAFGADFRDIDSGPSEGAKFTLLGTTPATTINLPDNFLSTTQFFGFVANAGETFTGLTITARFFEPSTREVLGIDNVTLASQSTGVPEPAAGAILALGCAALLRRRR
jgi:hypothetical protein